MFSLSGSVGGFLSRLAGDAMTAEESQVLRASRTARYTPAEG